MATTASLRPRRSPSLDTFLTPVNLPPEALLEALSSLCFDLISSYQTPPFQKKNSRSLLRVIQIFSILVDSIKDFNFTKLPSSSSDSLLLCLKEMYLVLYRSKMLFDYCNRSSKLWLLLQNYFVSGHFNDLSQEIYTLLDVLPIGSLGLNDDVKEHIFMLREQLRKSELFVDRADEVVRMKVYSLLSEFEEGRVPDKDDLSLVFVEKIGVGDVESCNAEIEHLEDEIGSHEEDDLEPNVVLLNGFVAMVRYCRFLLFGFEVDLEEVMRVGKSRKGKKGGVISQEIAETFVKVPKDFCCPVSLDFMSDPVVVCTGQTYERESITRWVDEGHHTCPKTGQLLEHRWVVPNRAVRNLITQWSVANGIPYDSPEHRSLCNETYASALKSRATLEANKATARLLIEQLAKGTQGAKAVAARAIRLLAKHGKENRAYIAEAGAVPHLKKLLSSRNAVTQENSVTAILNLSIYDKNKIHIMEEGCLESIVEVLRHGLTSEARENSAATLFSLSAVHDYKKIIGDEVGALEALAGMLREGTPRGRKDAVTALFNLSTHTDNNVRLIESGAVSALVDALESEIVAEEAAGALGLIVRQGTGAEAVGKEEKAVSGLLKMMRSGSPRGKENAVAALLELCRSGGATAAERVLRAPALASLLQLLLYTGTKRARRKAASLARVYQRCENNMSPSHGYPIGYRYIDHTTTGRDSSMASEFSVPVSIPVQVL